MAAELCQLWLTCSSPAEATAIANKLLSKKLIACAKQVPASSLFLWRSKIESGKEVVLIMDSRLEFFSHIERIVARIHSYDTFVLQAVPVVKVSDMAQNWLVQELKNE